MRLPLPFPATHLTHLTAAASHPHLFPRLHATLAARDDLLASNYRSNVSSLPCHVRVSGSADGRRSNADSREDLFLPSRCAPVTAVVVISRSIATRRTRPTKTISRNETFPSTRITHVIVFSSIIPMFTVGAAPIVKS